MATYDQTIDLSDPMAFARELKLNCDGGDKLIRIVIHPAAPPENPATATCTFEEGA